MVFTKMHGCGNDYIYIDLTREYVGDESATAIYLSDRHFGIGGDGVIYIKRSGIADAEMVMYNADGSRGAMCGNGIRCVAKYCYEKGWVKKKTFKIESMGAVKTVSVVTDESNKVIKVTVDMGGAILDAASIPVTYNGKSPVINVPLKVLNRSFNFTGVSMGNPHAVIFMKDKVWDFDVERYGRAIEKNTDIFPNRVNVEFANIRNRQNIDMRVWERGSGETLACGTGACATAVSAIINKLCDDTVYIHLLGGDLMIRLDRKTGKIFMTGPCESVFTGEISMKNFNKISDNFR